MNKKILLFDVSKGFSKFFIKKFKDQFEILHLHKSSQLNSCNLQDFHAIFFIVSNSDDLVHFTYFNSNLKTLFVVSNSALEIELFNMCDNLIVINLLKHKNDIVADIRKNLKLIL